MKTLKKEIKNLKIEIDNLTKIVNNMIQEEEENEKKAKILGVPVHLFISNEEIHFSYIVVDDIPKELQKSFSKWMHGQTAPIVSGYSDVVYSWDWERWVNNLLYNTPLIFD